MHHLPQGDRHSINLAANYSNSGGLCKISKQVLLTAAGVVTLWVHSLKCYLLFDDTCNVLWFCSCNLPPPPPEV